MKEKEYNTKYIGITNRLNEAIGYLKGKKETKTQKSIANKLEIDGGNLSKAISGNESYLTESFLRRFADVFELNTDWLLNGDGNMLLNISKDIIDKNEQQLLPPAGSKVKVPYYDVDFSGGWSSDEVFSMATPSFYITSPNFERAEFACNLSGNSISQIIPSGSVVGFKEIFNWQTYFLTNELYGIVTKNDLRTVKLVKRSKENKNNLVLIPCPLIEYDKAGYESEEIPMDFVARFYQVIAWAKFERLVM